LITNKNISSIKNIFTILIFLLPVGFSQQNVFHTPQNIKLFADYLFCDKDYLRAIEEYEKYLKTFRNDTIEFKIAYGFSQIADYKNALDKLSSINRSSAFYDFSLLEKLKLFYLENKIDTFFYEADKISSDRSVYGSTLKFKNIVTLLEKELPERNYFISPFDETEKPVVEKFYKQKKNPPYKSELTAGLLSAIIPGAGKIYTKNYGDGITAFLLTGIFAYLAYDNFQHNHQTRAWIFTALGAGFYVGNIYGSVSSAQIFNAKVNFDFKEGVKLYLEEKNYFIPDYEFCK
jgi:TM2 domain-containing membrane protein YozV